MSEQPVSSAAALLSSMPFARTCGIELTEAGPERVTGFVPWAPERCTAADVMHGGVIMALADSLGAACAFLNLPEGARTSTIGPGQPMGPPIHCTWAEARSSCRPTSPTMKDAGWPKSPRPRPSCAEGLARADPGSGRRCSGALLIHRCHTQAQM
jgi:hypothetical protein